MKRSVKESFALFQRKLKRKLRSLKYLLPYGKIHRDIALRRHIRRIKLNRLRKQRELQENPSIGDELGFSPYQRQKLKEIHKRTKVSFQFKLGKESSPFSRLKKLLVLKLRFVLTKLEDFFKMLHSSEKLKKGKGEKETSKQEISQSKEFSRSLDSYLSKKEKGRKFYAVTSSHFNRKR